MIFESDLSFLQVPISVCLTHVTIEGNAIQVLTLGLFFVFAHKALPVNLVNKVATILAQACITFHDLIFIV